MSPLLGSGASRVETLPPAAESDRRSGELPADVEAQSSSSDDRAGARHSDARDNSKAVARPGNESEGAGGGGATPTTVPATPRPESDDECSVREVEAAVVAAGDGPSCYFYASSEGGYEAAGDWRIAIRRGDEYMLYTSLDGSPNCGKTGTIRPGDYVEVTVKAGTAGAGRSYGNSCGG